MKELTIDQLTEQQTELLDAAEQAMDKAYNPYSGFYVGAALLTQDGEIISASNVENAAYGSTICAERMALGKANSEGYRMYDAIAIIGRGENSETGEPVPTQQVTSPCGSCRQMLIEASHVSEKDLEVIMATTNRDKIVISTIRELLPLSFGPLDLGVDVSKYQE